MVHSIIEEPSVAKFCKDVPLELNMTKMSVLYPLG